MFVEGRNVTVITLLLTMSDAEDADEEQVDHSTSVPVNIEWGRGGGASR